MCEINRSRSHVNYYTYVMDGFLSWSLNREINIPLPPTAIFKEKYY